MCASKNLPEPPRQDGGSPNEGTVAKQRHPRQMKRGPKRNHPAVGLGGMTAWPCDSENSRVRLIAGRPAAVLPACARMDEGVLTITVKIALRSGW